jgi:hypothetical protein
MVAVGSADHVEEVIHVPVDDQDPDLAGLRVVGHGLLHIGSFVTG